MGKSRGTPGFMPPFQNTPKILSPLQRNLISLHCLYCHPEYRHPQWWHVRESCGKASRESHRSLCQLAGKPDTAATAQEKIGHACLHLRRGLTPLWRLQRNPKIHVKTGEETSGSILGPRRGLGTRLRLESNPERPLTTPMETGLS